MLCSPELLLIYMVDGHVECLLLLVLILFFFFCAGDSESDMQDLHNQIASVIASRPAEKAGACEGKLQEKSAHVPCNKQSCSSLFVAVW